MEAAARQDNPAAARNDRRPVYRRRPARRCYGDGQGRVETSVPNRRSTDRRLGRRRPPRPARLVATSGGLWSWSQSKQGSTVGLTVVKRPEDYDAAVALARQYDDEVMIERFVPGRELTVGILEDEALAVGEIIPRHRNFRLRKCKYTPGMSEEIFPAGLPEAVTASKCSGCRGYWRTRRLRVGGYSRVVFSLDTGGENSSV